MRRWAEALPNEPPDLLVLDEFGPLEADGEGHMTAWPHIAAAAPAVVVIAVCDRFMGAVEARLGQPFDVRLSANDPETGDTLRALCVEQDDWVRIGLFGTGAGGIEATVGATLHAAHVPLRGLALSTMEAVVMTFAGDGLARRSRVVWVAFVSAGLKALSPAGGRLRPMLAIAAEGVLFTAATRVFGWNRPALFVAGAFVGMWAVTQGLVLQYLFVGRDLLVAFKEIVSWVEARGIGLPGLTAILVGWVGLWGAVSGGVTAWAFRRLSVSDQVDRALRVGTRRLPSHTAKASRREAVWGAARDLMRPGFWVPVLLVVAVILTMDSSWERAFWIAVRAATVAFLLFAAFRAVDPVKAALWLRRRGHWGPAEALGRAFGLGRGKR